MEEILLWGHSGIVVTAGRTLNIGDANGHTKSIPLSSQAQSIGCQVSSGDVSSSTSSNSNNKKYLDVVVSMVSKCFFARFDISHGIGSARQTSSVDIDFDLDSVSIFGSRICGLKDRVIYELVFQDQLGDVATKFKFAPRPGVDLEEFLGEWRRDKEAEKTQKARNRSFWFLVANCCVLAATIFAISLSNAAFQQGRFWPNVGKNFLDGFTSSLVTTLPRQRIELVMHQLSGFFETVRLVDMVWVLGAVPNAVWPAVAVVLSLFL